MLLLETQYFPSLAWCCAFWKESQVFLDASEHYQKGGFRNKCFIAGPNGEQRLSIPLVKGKHQQTPIQEVKISYAEPWQRQHWRSIQAAYGNAPYFEHYSADISGLFHQEWEYLFDLNQEIIRIILCQKLKWQGILGLENDYFKPGEWPRGTDGRSRLQITTPLPYPQVFQERHGFLPGLSILDLLFCCGKTAGEVLANTSISPN
jgi:hypothetical protein